MANFSYTASKSFTPFTFEEMLKPMAMYTQEYNTIQEGLSELGTKASVFNNLANSISDPKASAMYRKFSDDLSSQAEALANEGLSQINRKNLLDMRSRYAKEITPIEQAFSQRNKLSEEQRKLKATNPNLMFDVDFSQVSLDELLENPQLGYNTTDGKDLYNSGVEASKAASQRLIEEMPSLYNQYWRIKQGYGEDIANKFLLDNSNIPELKDAIQRIITQSGVTDNNKSRATNYILSGIMDGMSLNEKYQANRGYINPLEQERLNLAKSQFEWTKEKWEDELLGAKLPNGNRIKDIGGGRVRIVYPDGKVEIKASPSTSASTGKNSKQKVFSGLQFKMWNEDDATADFQEGLSNEEWTTKRKGFDISDEQLIPFNKLNKAMQTNLIAKLYEYGLTPDDIEIYRDKDTFSDNHYQVRLKQDKLNVTQELANNFGEL